MAFLCLICRKEFRTDMGRRGVREHVMTEHTQQPEWGVNIEYRSRPNKKEKHQPRGGLDLWITLAKGGL